MFPVFFSIINAGLYKIYIVYYLKAVKEKKALAIKPLAKAGIKLNSDSVT
jgi:hypothetical protein